MRTGVDKAIDALVKQGVATQDIVDFLNTNLTTKEMSEELARTLQENQRLRDEMPVVMRISQQQFNKHFRIIGKRVDGTDETRGRYKSKGE